jgi:DNA-binding transcriptional LysR family regulator
MKKEVIVQGMGWGHLPDYLIGDELDRGELVSIKGKHFAGGSAELVAARRRNVAHGPVAERLWRFIAAQAPLRRSKRRTTRHESLPRRTTPSRTR